MKRIAWLAALLLCSGSVLVVAQSGVDLSGSWVLDPSQSDNPGMGRGRGGSGGEAPVGAPPGGRRMGAGGGGGDMPPGGGAAWADLEGGGRE